MVRNIYYQMNTLGGVSRIMGCAYSDLIYLSGQLEKTYAIPSLLINAIKVIIPDKETARTTIFMRLWGSMIDR